MADAGSRQQDRVAIVTGGTGGIGAAVVRELAERGFAVAMTYRTNKDAAEKIVDDLRSANVITIPVNVAAYSEVESAFSTVAERLGGIDVVVHAAGARVEWQPLAELDVDVWHDYIDADFHGAFHVARSTVPHLRHRGGGQIVFMSSIAAQMCQPRNVQGAAAKAGVEAMMRVLAREEARNNIRANAVSVGLTDTAMGKDALEQWGPERAAKIIRGIPLRRIGTPQEVAKLVGYLVSDDATYITGKVIQIDGGQFIAG